MSVHPTIGVGSIAAAFDAYRRVPEFAPHASPARDKFHRRLDDDSAIILLARLADELVGFKVGYDRYRDGSFYSWMGGVVPSCRGHGIARSLLLQQEAAARNAGYRSIYVKTRNRFRAMRVLLARSGYAVVAVDGGGPTIAIDDFRLTLFKEL